MARLLIVGADGTSQIGGSFLRAAKKLSISATLCDTRQAWALGTLRQRLLWRCFDRRPLYFKRFLRAVRETFDAFMPDVLISTGAAPLDAAVLRHFRDRRCSLINFSTDDPFNAGSRCDWFLQSLPEYDFVFSPRRANLKELQDLGCRQVSYLPFGYDPDLFYPVVESGLESDLMFAGSAEPERVPYIAAATGAGFDVRLYGGFWNRYRRTMGVSRGQADIATLRQATAGARVALCLVRHQNRDGHSMRTFELPAVGACMVVEDTREHRDLFGEEAERVCYFRTPEEMVTKTKLLLSDEPMRRRLRDAAHQLITHGAHTYADRLRAMIDR